MNDEWQTPVKLYDRLNAEFKFEFDLCANLENTKCDCWSEDIKGFLSFGYCDEYGSYWMNPPYSRGKILECMDAATTLNENGKVVVCLVRLDPSTNWFQSCVDGVAKEVRMLDRRVKFTGAKDSYNFPCCIVVYDGNIYETEYRIWGW